MSDFFCCGRYKKACCEEEKIKTLTFWFHSQNSKPKMQHKFFTLWCWKKTVLTLDVFYRGYRQNSGAEILANQHRFSGYVSDEEKTQFCWNSFQFLDKFCVSIEGKRIDGKWRLHEIYGFFSLGEVHCLPQSQNDTNFMMFGTIAFLGQFWIKFYRRYPKPPAPMIQQQL